MMNLRAVEKTKRIAFLLSSLKFGGGERVALNLATALKEEGYLIDFLLMSHEGEFLAEAQTQFNVIDLRCDRTWKLPFKLWQYMACTRPTALISSFWKLNLCACLARAFCPTVRLAVWEHSPPSRSQNSPTWLYAISSSVLYRFATCVVAVSTGVAADVRRITFGLGRRVTTIFNPIQPPTGTIVKRPPAERRKLIWVGRLDTPKNPGLVLEAFARLPRGMGYTLDLIGDGALRASLVKRAQALDISERVHFHGFRPDPYEHMSAADVLVLSSDREGLPTVLIEALYVGLDVVSTDCGGGIHDILQDNLYGTIVPVNDPAEMATAIERALDRSPEPVRQRVGARRFEPRGIARQFLSALRIGGQS